MLRAFSTAVGILIAVGVLDVTAQQPAKLVSTKGASATKISATGLLPGTSSNVLTTTIQGNALNATNGVLPNAVVRLRDVRFGRVAGTTITDKSGLFEFRGIDPGSYVIRHKTPF